MYKKSCIETHVSENDMDGNDDIEIDPAMAAQMGFSSFGMQNNTKKRKYGHNDAVVDAPAAPSKQSTTGANTTQLGIRDKSNVAAVDAASPAPAQPGDHHSAASPQTLSQGGAGLRPEADKPSALLTKILEKDLDDLEQQDLHALAKGLPNDSGDAVYFKPSFLMDPWATLRPGTAQSSLVSKE